MLGTRHRTLPPGNGFGPAPSNFRAVPANHRHNTQREVVDHAALALEHQGSVAAADIPANFSFYLSNLKEASLACNGTSMCMHLCMPTGL